MEFRKINIWYVASLLISLVVAAPILTVFSSFFENTGNYSLILKNTFLYDYIYNSLLLLIGVLFLTFMIGVGCAYLVSFYNFPGVNFFKWSLILSFAVPAYIYAYSLTAFFENYGTAFSILKNIFGEGNYNIYLPKFDGMIGAIISISFSLFGYVYVLTRASFHYQSQNLIELGKNLGFSKQKSFFTSLSGNSLFETLLNVMRKLDGLSISFGEIVKKNKCPSISSVHGINFCQ